MVVIFHYRIVIEIVIEIVTVLEIVIVIVVQCAVYSIVIEVQCAVYSIFVIVLVVNSIFVILMQKYTVVIERGRVVRGRVSARLRAR